MRGLGRAAASFPGFCGVEFAEVMLIRFDGFSSCLMPSCEKGLAFPDGLGLSILLSPVPGVVEGETFVLWGFDCAGELADGGPPNLARRLLRICPKVSPRF